jgi:hypothetical protein
MDAAGAATCWASAMLAFCLVGAVTSLPAQGASDESHGTAADAGGRGSERRAAAAGLAKAGDFV